MKKRFLLTFIVFICTFFCFGINGKALGCNYILSNNNNYTDYESPADDYVKFYNYLYYKKFNSVDVLKNVENLRKIKKAIEATYVPHTDWWGSKNPLAISGDLKKLNFTINIQGSKVVSSELFIYTSSKKYNSKYEYKKNQFNVQNSCPDLLFLKRQAVSLNDNGRGAYQQYFNIETATYLDGNYSDFYTRIKYPEDFENGEYLVAISTSTGFEGYYNGLKCILKGDRAHSFSYKADIDSVLKALKEKGFNYEQINENNIDDTLKPLILNSTAEEIKNYNNIFKISLELNSMNQCFGATDVTDSSMALNWLNINDKNNSMKYVIILKPILEDLNEKLPQLKTALMDNNINENADWNMCRNECQGKPDDMIEDCYEQCDIDYPIATCQFDNKKVYDDCTKKCGDNGECLDACKENFDSNNALCAIRCDKIVDNNKNTAEKKLYEMINPSCDKAGASYKKCMISTCELYKQNPNNLDTIKTAYNDIINGTTEAQRDLKESTEKVYIDLIKMGGIDIEGGDLCLILKDLQPYIDIVINIIRIGGPLLVLILTGLDAMKTIGSSNEEENKKFFNRLKIRLICVAILILVPTIIDFLVNLAIDPDCMKKG